MSASGVCRPNIAILGVSEPLWWHCVDPRLLLNLRSHVDMNMVKYVFSVTGNEPELVSATSLLLYPCLCLCGLLLVGC